MYDEWKKYFEKNILFPYLMIGEKLIESYVENTYYKVKKWIRLFNKNESANRLIQFHI